MSKRIVILIGLLLVLGLSVAIVLVGPAHGGGYRLCAQVACHSTGYCRCVP